MPNNAWCHVGPSSNGPRTPDQERDLLLTTAAVRYPGKDVDFTIFDDEAMTGEGRKVTITAAEAAEHVRGKRVAMTTSDERGVTSRRNIEFA